MKIYKNKDLKEEIEVLDLGIVEAGDKKSFTFYVKNDSNAYLRNMEFMVDHAEVKVLRAPREMFADSSDEIIVEWNPSVNLKEGLKAQLLIKGQELWG